MYPVSQIIGKNLHRQRGVKRVLWINPDNDDCWRKIRCKDVDVHLFCQMYGAYRFHQQAGGEVEYAAFPDSRGHRYPWIILNLPRQKALLGMLLECVARLLTEDGVLWLAGENKAGIKSADKLLQQHFRHVTTLDNARHCVLYEAARPLRQPAFDPADYRTTWPLQCAGRSIDIYSYPGVFAHGRLDPGSALLLETLDRLPVAGEVLDFGCGAGVIGACIAARSEKANVTFLDASAVALMACRETLRANQLRGTLLASDGLSELKTTYDLVISNPPIHVGVVTDNGLGTRLLQHVRKHINTGGRLILVANRHLPIETWLSSKFRRTSTLAANDHFKVLSARPGEAHTPGNFQQG